MDSERRADIGIAVATITVAAAIAAATRGFPEGAQSGDPGPVLLPLLVALALGALGVTRLVLRGARSEEPHPPGMIVPALIMLGVGGVALWAMTWVGFLVGAAVLLLAGALIAGERRPVRIALYATLAPVAVYVAFSVAFSVRLPTGPLETLLI